MKNLLIAATIISSSIVASDYFWPKAEVTPIAEVEQLQKAIDHKPKSPYFRGTPVKLTKSEQVCLARNIYFEAGVEPYAGKIAVAQVTLNRLRSGRWGNNVCDVVHARKQFSWTLLKHKVNEQPAGALWQESLQAMHDVKQGLRVQGLETSDHYHAEYVTPVWRTEKVRVAKIGRHIFYSKKA